MKGFAIILASHFSFSRYAILSSSGHSPLPPGLSYPLLLWLCNLPLRSLTYARLAPPNQTGLTFTLHITPLLPYLNRTLPLAPADYNIGLFCCLSPSLSLAIISVRAHPFPLALCLTARFPGRSKNETAAPRPFKERSGPFQSSKPFHGPIIAECPFALESPANAVTPFFSPPPLQTNRPQNECQPLSCTLAPQHENHPYQFPSA